jgi:hypothetical protein
VLAAIAGQRLRNFLDELADDSRQRAAGADGGETERQQLGEGDG